MCLSIGHCLSVAVMLCVIVKVVQPRRRRRGYFLDRFTSSVSSPSSSSSSSRRGVSPSLPFSLICQAVYKATVALCVM